MKRGLLLKENARRISCIPHYSIGISNQQDKSEIGRELVLVKLVRAGGRRSIRAQQPSKQIAHQVVIFLIVNAWILCRIANALEHRRLTSVCPTDNKDPKVGILRSKFSRFSMAFEPVLDPGEHKCRQIYKIKEIRKVQPPIEWVSKKGKEEKKRRKEGKGERFHCICALKIILCSCSVNP